MRDQLLAFIYTRLTRYVQWEDPRDILDEELRASALELLRILGNQTTDFEAVNAIAQVFWLRYTLLPRGEDEEDFRLALSLYRAIHRVNPEAVPYNLREAMTADPGAPITRVSTQEVHAALLTNLQAAINADDAEQILAGIRMLRRVLNAIPQGHADWPDIAATLGASYGALYQLTNDPEHLNVEIATLEACVEAIYRRPASTTPAAKFLPEHLQLLCDALEARYKRFSEGADLDRAIRTQRRALSLTESVSEEHGTRTYHLGKMLLTHAGRSRSLADLDEAIEVLQAACSPQRSEVVQPAWLHAFGDGMLQRYNLTTHPADLDAAIAAFTTAIEIAGNTPIYEALNLLVVAEALHERFALRADIADSDKAISMLQRAVSEGANTSDVAILRGSQYGALGISFRERYLVSGDLNDLIASATAFRDGTACSPADSGAKALTLQGLGATLFCLYECTADNAYRDEALYAYTILENLETADVAHRDHARVMLARLDSMNDWSAIPETETRCKELDYEASRARERYRSAHKLNDLNRAITFTKLLLDVSGVAESDHVTDMILLGEDLLERHKRAGWTSDLDEALHIAGQAVESATGSEYLAAALCTAANAWCADYEARRDRSSLDSAIAAATNSIAMASPTSKERAWSYNALGTSLMRQFGESRDADDARRAVAALRQALTIVDPDEPRKRPILSNLATALRSIYENTEDVDLLDEAIELLRTASADAEPSSLELISLGGAYLSRHQLTADSADTDRAREAFELALAGLPPSDQAYSIALDGLFYTIMRRPGRDPARFRRAIDLIKKLIEKAPSYDGAWHYRLGLLFLESSRSTVLDAFHDRSHRDDLNNAVAGCRRALELTSADHESRVEMLAGLSRALHSRYAETHSMPDLHEAEALARQALAELPGPSSLELPLKALLSLVLRSRLDESHDPDVRAEAIRLSEEVGGAAAAHPQIRALEARRAAAMYAAIEDWRTAAERYELALDLTPIATPHPELLDQIRHIRPGRLAADGAACWLNAGNPERAALMLERGRAVLLSQTIANRAEVTALRAERPDLADRYEALRNRLNRPSPADSEHRGIWVKPDSPMNRAAATAEFEALVDAIREIPGHERFLLPPKIDDLLAITKEGPVVILNASNYRCDALIVRPEGIRVVRLSGVTIERLFHHGAWIQMAGANAHNSKLTTEDRTSLHTRSTEALAWLWDHIAAPVLEELGITRRPAENQWPRVWWVPDGAFSWLPIHAAGRHGERDSPDAPTLLDRVQSSYIPTVSQLTYARASLGRRTLPSRVLVVAMPKTPGQPDLPAAEAETRTIAGLFPTTILGTAAGASGPADCSNIIAELPTHDVVHFACHAHGDWIDPSRSFLAIQSDPSQPGETGTLRLIDVASLDLQGQQLAFLSGCATARPTDVELLDEVTHLASAFHQAGFTHVIGTLWEVDDRAAAMFASEIYPRLAASPSAADPNRAALAVHEATRALRKVFFNDPMTWASHVYVGP